MDNQNLLLLDDDTALRKRLERAMEQRGFMVTSVASVKEGIEASKLESFDYAILDLKLEVGSGLDVVKALHQTNADCRVVILTGFGNIATAVAAVKAQRLITCQSQPILIKSLPLCCNKMAQCRLHQRIR